MPITVICLDRLVPTHFTKHALTGFDREKEKREGWKETMRETRNEGRKKLKKDSGGKRRRSTRLLSPHPRPHSWELAGSLNPLQQFIEGSVSSIKGFFPQDLLTAPPVIPFSPPTLI